MALHTLLETVATVSENNHQTSLLCDLMPLPSPQPTLTQVEQVYCSELYNSVLRICTSVQNVQFILLKPVEVLGFSHCVGTTAVG